MKNKVKNLIFYKYRFLIGFSLFAIFAIIFTSMNFWNVPNGLTDAEMLSASNAVGVNLNMIIDGVIDFANLPFLILQHISINLFGLTTFALRLPSIILMLLALASLITAFSYSQNKNISYMTGILIVSSPLFLSIARSGTADSMAIFLLSIILLVSIILTSGEYNKRFLPLLEIILCSSAALLVYSPGGIFIVGLLVFIGLLHPKTRYKIFRNKKYKLLIGLIPVLIILAPLAWGLTNGNISAGIFGFSEWNFANVSLLLNLFFIPGTGAIYGVVTPVVSILIISLFIYGIIRLIYVIDSARTRFVLPLTLAGLIFVVGNPALIFWLFVPISFGLATGLDGFVNSWYKLFPRNPYARTFALPLIAALILFSGISSMKYYYATNFYSEYIVSDLNHEFSAARNQISRNEKQILVVPSDQVLFYQKLIREYDNLIVTTEIPDNFAENSLIVLNSTDKKSDKKIAEIVTSFAKNDSVLLRKY